MLGKRSGLLFLLVVTSLIFVAQKHSFVAKVFGNDPAPLLSVTGMVTVDGLPVSSDIQISSLKKNDRSFLNVKARESDGLFVLNLPKGDLYELVIRVKHFPPQIIELNTTNIDSSISLNTFADFISPAFDQRLEELKRSVNEKLNPGFVPSDFEKNYGASIKNGLSYKVQIGAFRFIENFNYNAVIGMPKIIRQTDTDAITRFTMGNFETFNQANELLKKLRLNTNSDAFIIATYNGQKKYLQQLIEEKILY